MNWQLPVGVAGGLLVFVAWKRLSLVPLARARQLWRQGAWLVDVREPREFNSGHLRKAINLPLTRLDQDAPRRIPDKGQAMLLHCLSGSRSGTARRQLQTLGYRQVFNLGSYRRAERLVRDASSQ